MNMNLNSKPNNYTNSNKEIITKNVYFVPIIIILALFTLGQILINGFVSSLNIGNILTMSSIIAVITVSQILVILVGGDGIDLSVGAVASMGAVNGLNLINGDARRIPYAILMLIIIGAIIGIINALGVQVIKIPPLIMTMTMATVVNGFTLAFSQGMPGSTPEILLKLGQILIGPIHWIFVIAVIIVVIGELYLKRSKLGRSLFLVGSNRNGAKLCGININVAIFFAYTVSAIISALAGLMLAGYSGSAMLKMADGYTMLSVAAAVIGGTKLAGGDGSLSGGFLGAIIFTLITTLLTTMGFPQGVRILVQGLTLLIVLVIYSRDVKLRQ